MLVMISRPFGYADLALLGAAMWGPVLLLAGALNFGDDVYHAGEHVVDVAGHYLERTWDALR